MDVWRVLTELCSRFGHGTSAFRLAWLLTETTRYGSSLHSANTYVTLLTDKTLVLNCIRVCLMSNFRSTVFLVDFFDIRF